MGSWIIIIIFSFFHCPYADIRVDNRISDDPEATTADNSLPQSATVRNIAATFKVMTFNTWQSGGNVENGFYKIAKHILYVYPDIVAIQEFHSASDAPALLQLLGPEWSGIGKRQGQDTLDTAILTRHELLPQVADLLVTDSPAEKNGGKRASIRLRLKNLSKPFVVNFWSLHLDYHDYGPYALCNKMVTKIDQIEAGEHYTGGDVPGRIENILAITTDPMFLSDLDQAKSREGAPILVLGDMNTPSHLDYTEQTKQRNCGWAYQWPITLTFMKANLTDAYRFLNPDPLAIPGNTWSTAQKFQSGWGGTIPEPQDRIDMVFFKSPILTPVNAQVYAGSEPIKPEPLHYYNDWPSDHASVVVDFQITE